VYQGINAHRLFGTWTVVISMEGYAVEGSTCVFEFKPFLSAQERMILSHGENGNMQGQVGPHRVGPERRLPASSVCTYVFGGEGPSERV
jgi:hypothetical protein